MLTVSPHGTKHTEKYNLDMHLDGKLDLINGKYADENPTYMKCKYTEEIRLCIGVAAVTPLDCEGKPTEKIGKKIVPFDYSRAVLLSISDFDKK